MKKSNFQRYFWTTIWVSCGIVLGITAVCMYAYYETLNAYSLLLWSFAYIAMGGLAGFIFSIPKIISETAATTMVNPANLTSPTVKNKVQENTNLTEISDWLTKILIGASLVELKEVPKFILHTAKVMAEGIRKLPLPDHAINSSAIVDSATIACAAIILYFITWGFISGYLVMKLILTEQFAEI